MTKNLFKLGMVGALLLGSLQGYAKADRFPAASPDAALKNLSKLCGEGGKNVKSGDGLKASFISFLKQNAAEGAYLRGNGQKISTVRMTNGKYYIASLNDCKDEVFHVDGVKFLEGKISSGQLFILGDNGRVYVLAPQRRDRDSDSAYKIMEIGTKSGKSFKREFGFMKRSSRGTQTMYVWPMSAACVKGKELQDINCDIEDDTNGHTLVLEGKVAENDASRLISLTKEVVEPSPTVEIPVPAPKPAPRVVYTERPAPAPAPALQVAISIPLVKVVVTVPPRTCTTRVKKASFFRRLLTGQRFKVKTKCNY